MNEANEAQQVKLSRPEGVKTLSEAGAVAHVAAIQHHGEKLTIPEGMSIPDAIDLLKRREKYLQEETSMAETFDVFPFDGANAVNEVLCARFGFAAGERIPSFFGSQPPQLLSVEVGPGVFRRVPWGRVSIPGVEGYLQTVMTWDGDRLKFVLHGVVRRADEATIASIFNDVRVYLKDHSIYLGQAVKIRFLDNDGDRLPIPEVRFIDTKEINEDNLIFSDSVSGAIETNLFTPIRRVRELVANGIPVKRSTLLGGTYGTGKTLAAAVASKLAVQAGVTHIYVPRADELAIAVQFAMQYANPACMIFCEDIDRVLAGERTVEMDDILNIIDGIDSKSSNIMCVLTSNDLEAINPAMLRPGRLDAVIEVTPPDAKAVERLLRAYGGDTIAPETDLSRAGTLLNGSIPAVIAEVVKRAKLAQLRMQPIGQLVTSITEDAIVEAAATMSAQLKLLESKLGPKEEEPTLDGLFADLVERIVADATERMAGQVSSIAKAVDA